MKHIAILGASSQIAQDLILGLAPNDRYQLQLYARDLSKVEQWLSRHGLVDRCSLHTYPQYGQLPHDTVINFIGVGDPMRAAQMGESIFSITLKYDDLVLKGLESDPERRYIFLSSGSAYCNPFLEPATAETRTSVAVNAVKPQDYYPVAKFHAECRHRALPQFSISDIRVFNYFSRYQNIEARFFITDILRAVRDAAILKTSPDAMVRDYLHPKDFCQLIERILDAPKHNGVFDCYSKSPITKVELLETMKKRFNLQYEVVAGLAAPVNATGTKPHYYSKNHAAAAIGYEPVYSSLDTIFAEAPSMLEGRGKVAVL